MSLATVTVTVLPVLLAHASVAALTALVSASPEEAMSILRSTGPLADAGALGRTLLLETTAAAAGGGEQGAAQHEGEGGDATVACHGMDSFVGHARGVGSARRSARAGSGGRAVPREEDGLEQGAGGGPGAPGKGVVEEAEDAVGDLVQRLHHGA